MSKHSTSDSDFDYQEYEKMNRADNKRQQKIERHEKSFGHDEIIWEQIDDKGVLLKQENWFINLPNDQLMDRLYQTQNQFFSIVAKIKECSSPADLKRLKGLLAAKNELIEYLQELLAR